MAWKITVDEAGGGRILKTIVMETALNDAVELALSDVKADDDEGRSFQITATPSRLSVAE